MTPEEALPLVILTLDHVEPPSGWKRQRAPDEPSPRVSTAILWAEAFTLAGLTVEQARQGLVRYLSQPVTGPYPLRWPEPGRVIAFTVVGRTALAMGTPTDADAAFEHFVARMAYIGFMPSRDVPSRMLDPDDPVRNDAMFMALDRFGGAGAWRCVPTQDANGAGFASARKRWTAFYAEVRSGQSVDAPTVRIAASVRPTLRLVTRE